MKIEKKNLQQTRFFSFVKYRLMLFSSNW